MRRFLPLLTLPLLLFACTQSELNQAFPNRNTLPLAAAAITVAASNPGSGGSPRQYRVAGWQPQALLPLFRTAGYQRLTDGPISPGNYAAFSRHEGAELKHLTTREGQTTLITISGKS